MVTPTDNVHANTNIVISRQLLQSLYTTIYCSIVGTIRVKEIQTSLTFQQGALPLRKILQKILITIYIVHVNNMKLRTINSVHFNWFRHCIKSLLTKVHKLMRIYLNTPVNISTIKLVFLALQRISYILEQFSRIKLN